MADKTAEYRPKYNMKTPDAILLATAEICGADYVLTNDAEWQKIENLNIVLLDDLN
nr:PIN domain-containing protein [Desulfobulbaceae bacterium]